MWSFKKNMRIRLATNGTPSLRLESRLGIGMNRSNPLSDAQIVVTHDRSFVQKDCFNSHRRYRSGTHFAMTVIHHAGFIDKLQITNH